MKWRPPAIAVRVGQRSIFGLSLVELMVAITIGLIILTALVRLFATSRGTYNLEENLARVQESGRFAMEFLAQDIRMAGYAGCSANLSGSSVTNLVSPSASATTFNPDGITGYKYTCTSGCTGALTEWDPDLPATYFSSGNVSPLMSTDVVIIQRADAISTHISENSVSNSLDIKVNSTASVVSNISADDVLILSDCKNADVFKITTISSGSGTATMVHSNTGNTGNFLGHTYGTDAQIMKLITRVYFIGRRSNIASNPPSLFRRELANNGSLQTLELIEGIELLRISYGEDTDSDRVVNVYRDPASVSNWRKVLSARVGILAKTTVNVDQDPDTRTYDIAMGTAGPFNDNVRRRAFNSTIQLRNH